MEKKRLLLEWQRLFEDPKDCERCSQTHLEIQKAVEMMSADTAFGNVDVQVKKYDLVPMEIAQSNTVSLNGLPLETLLEAEAVTMTSCTSCSCSMDQDVDCRAVVIDGVTYEKIPAELIVKAAKNVLHMDT
jgi:hypothetical protein